MVDLITAVRLIPENSSKTNTTNIDVAVTDEIDCLADFSPRAKTALVIKNLAQMNELKALERMLSVVYAHSVTFSDLLDTVGCDRETNRLLRQVDYVPLASLLHKSLVRQMTTTDEGKRSYALAQILFGFAQAETSSVSAIANKLSISAAEARQAIIRLKAKLQTQLMRQSIESMLKSSLFTLQSSSYFRSLPLPARDGILPLPDSRDALIAVAVQELVASASTHSTINIISGRICPETEIAYEVALTLSRSGKKVLLVNHSRMLAIHLRKLYDQERQNDKQDNTDDSGSLTISTFHALCHWAAREADLRTPKFRSPRIFNEIFPELLVEAVHLRPEIQFDAIIVCEGHCFGPNLWRALKHCLKDSIRGLYIYFYDPQLLSFNRLSLVPFAAKTIDLQAICPQFHSVVQSNEKIELYESTSAVELCQTVQFIVDDLISAAGYNASDIVILSAANEKSKHRFKFNCGVKVCHQLPTSPSKPGLLETSLFQFRSMTARIVILIDLDDYMEKLSDWKLQYFCYLLFGRAMEKLVLVGSKAMIAKVLPPQVASISTAEIVFNAGIIMDD